MYLPNKYTRWYYNIIHRAQERSISGYTEKHHIIPRSLGGINKKENLVHLTAKEHFICHILLIKMLVGKEKAKMVYAAWQLANQENTHQTRFKITGSTYERLKIHFSVTHSERMKNNHHFNNPEIRERHRLSIIKRGPTSIKGQKRSETTKEKLRNKIWTEKALQSRLANCIANAKKRKGIKNPKHGESIFKNYVSKNKDIILQIWKLYNSGKNRRQISIELGISWDRVNLAINKTTEIKKLLEQ